jgi:FkbM family methyltransferase
LERALFHMRPAAALSVAKVLLRVRRREIHVPAGRFLVDPVSYLGAEIISTGGYEPSMTRRLADNLSAGMTFVDVGANEGYFTVMASALVGAGGRVVAIEPQASVADVLDANLKLNGCSNVNVVRTAVGDTAGVLTLHIMPSVNNGASSATPPVRYRTRREHVAQVKLDDLLVSCGVETVDLMKIDVEGYESHVIEGAREALRRGTVKHVALELHPRQLRALGTTSEDVVLLMESLGFACTVNGDSAWCVHGGGTPRA